MENMHTDVKVKSVKEKHKLNVHLKLKKAKKNLNEDSPKLSALMFAPFPHLLLSPPHPPTLIYVILWPQVWP